MAVLQAVRPMSLPMSLLLHSPNLCSTPQDRSVRLAVSTVMRQTWAKRKTLKIVPEGAPHRSKAEQLLLGARRSMQCLGRQCQRRIQYLGKAFIREYNVPTRLRCCIPSRLQTLDVWVQERNTVCQ